MKIPFTVVMFSVERGHCPVHGKHQDVEDAIVSAKNELREEDGDWQFVCAFAGIQHPLQYDEEGI